LTHAAITSHADRALVLSYAAIGGKLDCRSLVVTGETRAIDCRVTRNLLMYSARLDNPTGMALFAGGLDVGGGTFFGGGFQARGGVRLIGAHLRANLTMEGATFENPGGVAVNLERADIGPLFGDGLACKGQLSVSGARIRGDLSLARAVLESGVDTRALEAERAQIDGTLILREAKAVGELNLRGVRIGERLLLMRAELHNPARTTCRLSRAQVAADLLCDQLTSTGKLRLAGAVVGGAITLRGVVLTSGTDLAVDAKNLSARELVLQPATPIDGEVDLSHATIGVLRDDPATWPERLRLNGFTYQALDPLLTAGQRLQWLARDQGGYQPQPYEQLAAHYTTLGQSAQGRSVLYARERILRRNRSLVVRAWGALQDITVGYGYRPSRALAWIGLLLATGSIVFSAAPPPPLQATAAPHFNGIIYTLDLMLPVVNLGQKYAFNPSGPEQWLSYFLIAAGWTLATTVAAGVARVLQRS
jgi:hypothetical protein